MNLRSMHVAACDEGDKLTVMVLDLNLAHDTLLAAPLMCPHCY